jgi:hypothetical protein
MMRIHCQDQVGEVVVVACGTLDETVAKVILCGAILPVRSKATLSLYIAYTVDTLYIKLSRSVCSCHLRRCISIGNVTVRALSSIQLLNLLHPG